MSASEAIDKRMLDLAARVAWRAVGDVEPNPLVGCVIGRERDGDVEILGIGHHRRFGGDHAEIDALKACHQRDRDVRGATMWVTLEPCVHTGKTGPCADAVIRAGVARVVIAVSDPGEVSRGGACVLANAGVETRFTAASVDAVRLSQPWRHRLETGRPWVIAKWAQTDDGALTTPQGQSNWISNERSRLDVHRLRAKVDAILSAVGTVLADDPLLTARGVRRIRRVATRVIVDSSVRTSPDARVLSMAADAPIVVAASKRRLTDSEVAQRAASLRESGARVEGFPTGDQGVDLESLLRWLSESTDASTVMTEAGSQLLESLAEKDLIDEAQVYVGGEKTSVSHACDPPATLRFIDGNVHTVVSTRRFGADRKLVYRRPDPACRRDAGFS